MPARVLSCGCAETEPLAVSIGNTNLKFCFVLDTGSCHKSLVEPHSDDLICWSLVPLNKETKLGVLHQENTHAQNPTPISGSQPF